MHRTIFACGLFVTVGGVLAALLVGFWPNPANTATQIDERAGPVDFDVCSGLDFGSGKPGERIQRRFTIYNRRDCPMDFTTQVSCGACLEVSPAHGEIPANGSVEVAVKMKVPKRGTSQNSVIQVLTGQRAGEEAVKALAAKISCPALLDVGLTHVQMGHTVPGKPVTVELSILRSLVAPADIVLAAEQGVVRDARIVDRGNGEYAVRITTRGDLTLGLHTEVIRVHTPTDSTLDGELSVSVEVNTRFRCAPSSLEVTADKLKAGVRVVVTRSDGELVAPLAGCSGKSGLRVEDLGESKASYRRLLRITAVDATATLTGRLDIRFGSDPEPLGLPVQIVAHP